MKLLIDYDWERARPILRFAGINSDTRRRAGMTVFLPREQKQATLPTKHCLVLR